MLKNKTILLGITGGIAAYKVYELIRLYRKNGAVVRVVLTENALNFVNVLTLQTLSGNKVHVKQYETECFSPEHISLADACEIFVIAPATANTIGKLANGICDNLLTSIACAYKKPIILAPAMNTGMWENDTVRTNIKKLEANGVEILQPESGYLACGTEGVGRMCEPAGILQKTVDVFESSCGNSKKLSGKKVVITSGGTRENIDPVRFISNYSSGKMGLALANVAVKMGADTVLITTQPIENSRFKIVLVNTALEMESAVESEFKNADCLIMAAAVADYRPKITENQKIKKTNDGKDETFFLELVKNPDILTKMSDIKTENQLVVGFCAETENLIENAKEKIIRKKCDFIVANDVSRKDIAFGADFNEVCVVDKNLNIKVFEKDTKANIAKGILEFIFDEKKGNN